LVKINLQLYNVACINGVSINTIFEFFNG